MPDGSCAAPIVLHPSSASRINLNHWFAERTTRNCIYQCHHGAAEIEAEIRKWLTE